MADESTSPLKAFVRRYSPIKSRNKPLPAPPPADNSPVRKPVAPVSGNAAFTKQPPTSQSQTKGRFSKLLRRQQSYDTSDLPSRRVRSPISARQDEYRVSKSRAKHGNPGSPKSPVSNTPSITRLTKKVSTLEAQLVEARKELQALASPRNRAPSPFEYNRLIEARQASLGTSGRYNGLVENLLDAGTHSDRRIATGGSCNGKSSIRMRASSADLADVQRVVVQQSRSVSDHVPRDLQQGSLSGAAPKQNHAVDYSPNTLKRKRSEMREAEWARIQQHIAEQGDGPAAQRQKHKHDRPLPPAPADTRHATKAELQRGPQQRVSKMPYSRTKSTENVEVFRDENEQHETQDDNRPATPPRRLVTSPSRLGRIQEEYEWDEDVF